MSLFDDLREQAYPHRFRATLLVATLAGGVPTDPKVAEGWLRTKMADKDDLIREMVATTMAERGIPAEEAIAEVDSLKHLNGFKRNADGLYIEGRQVKAAIKEAANVRWPKDRWGPSRKGTLSYFAEHVFVVEDTIPLGVVEASGINQRFVHTWRGTGIQYEEYVTDAKVSFTVVTDSEELTRDRWGMLWLTGEQQGVGASRSQGFGRYEIVEWESLT
jgi:hypothetical protein